MELQRKYPLKLKDMSHTNWLNVARHYFLRAKQQDAPLALPYVPKASQVVKRQRTEDDGGDVTGRSLGGGLMASSKKSLTGNEDLQNFSTFLND